MSDEPGAGPFAAWPAPDGTAPAAPAASAGRWARPRAFAAELRRAFDEAQPLALASQLAYSLIFALPSLILVCVLVAVAVERRTGVSPLGELRQAVIGSVPDELRGPIDGMVGEAVARAAQPAPTIGAVTTALIALWAAGGGVQAFARACALAAGDRDLRPVWVRRALATWVTLLLALMLTVVFALLLFGETLWRSVTAWLFGVPAAGQGASLLRALGGQVLVLLFVFFLYRTSLGRGWRLSDLAIGAAAATVAWALATEGFQLFLRFSDPGSAYGAASSVLVLLSYLWTTSLILIGGAMTSAVLRHRQTELGSGLRDGARGAVAATEPALTVPPAWRRWLAPLLIALWCLLAPLALAAAWTHGVLLDTPRYVATADRLAANPDVQTLMASTLSEALVGSPTGGDGLLMPSLSRPQRLLARQLVPPATRRAVASEAFAAAWHTANEHAHRALLAALEGDDAGPVTLQLDPETLLPPIQAELKAAGLPVPAFSAPSGPVEVTLLGEAQTASLRGRADLLARLALWLPVAAAASLLGGLLAATRRARALRWALVGAGVAMGVLLAALTAGPGLLAGQSADPASRQALAMVAAEVLHPLQAVALVLAVAGVVAGLLVPQPGPAEPAARAPDAPGAGPR